MKRLIFCTLLFVSTVSWADSEQNFDVAKLYYSLSKKYNESIMNGNYGEAYKAAMEQLSLDPSDTAAYLRMAIVVQHLDVNGSDLYIQYSPEITEHDAFHIDLKSIASALLKSPKYSK